jgi:hypothetical protein
MSPGPASAGLALVGLSLFFWLLGQHFREGRWFDRPGIARHPLFDPFLAVVRWSALVAGLALLWRAAPPAAVVTAVLLLIMTGWRRVARSAIVRARSMRRRQSALSRANPGLSERDALRRVILERHPEWGEELVEQMILDYGSTEELARVMTRMERGFRGFR